MHRIKLKSMLRRGERRIRPRFFGSLAVATPQREKGSRGRISDPWLGSRLRGLGRVRHVSAGHSLDANQCASACLSMFFLDFASEGRLPDRNGLVCSSALAPVCANALPVDPRVMLVFVGGGVSFVLSDDVHYRPVPGVAVLTSCSCAYSSLTMLLPLLLHLYCMVLQPYTL